MTAPTATIDCLLAEVGKDEAKYWQYDRGLCGVVLYELGGSHASLATLIKRGELEPQAGDYLKVYGGSAYVCQLTKDWMRICV